MRESTRHSGCVDWHHANGPLYPGHLSGTRNPRVLGIGKAVQATHTLNPWRLRPNFLDGSLTTSDVPEPGGKWPFSMWMHRTQRWPVCVLDGWEHSMANKLPLVLSWQPCGGDCKKHAGIPRSLTTAASTTEARQTCANPQKLPADTNAGGRGSSKRPRTDTARTRLSGFSRTSMKRRLWKRVNPSCGHGETS